MMNQLGVAAIVLLGLVGSAHMQTNGPSGPLQPVGNLLGGLQLDKLLGGVLGGQPLGQINMNRQQSQWQPQQPQWQPDVINSLLSGLLQQQQQQQQQQQPGNGVGNLLGSLGVNLQQQPGNELGNTLGLPLGVNLQAQQQQLPQMQGNGDSGDANSRLLTFLRQLPQQGMKIIGNLLDGARNILPDLGRNQQSPWNQSHGQNSSQKSNQNQGTSPVPSKDQLSMTNPTSNELTNSGSQSGARDSIRPIAVENRPAKINEVNPVYPTALPSGNNPTFGQYA